MGARAGEELASKGEAGRGMGVAREGCRGSIREGRDAVGAIIIEEAAPAGVPVVDLAMLSKPFISVRVEDSHVIIKFLGQSEGMISALV